MRLRDYIWIHKLWFISTAVIVLLTNGILFASLPLNQGTADILYMDVLIITSQLGLFVYGFIRQRRMVASFLHDEKLGVRKRTEKPPRDFYIDTMKEALENQHNQFLVKEEEYKKQMNESQEYITQWVHDIKVNLAVCELLLEEMENGQELRNQIGQMRFRINQFLQMARENHYNQDMAAVEVDVRQEVRNAIKENALFFIHKNIEIETDLKPFYIITDKKCVFDILCQLINNSSKYTASGGRVTLSSEETDRAYYVRIRDNGMGIPREDLPRIFNKGFTGRNGRAGTKSSGMGLYYAQKMAKRLCIGLEAASEEGAYTEITVIFYKLSDYYTISAPVHG